jgi:hypothetical protein
MDTTCPFLVEGNRYLIMTVSQYYEGVLLRQQNGWVEIKDVVMVFETGRLDKIDTEGSYDYCEPMFDNEEKSMFVPMAVVQGIRLVENEARSRSKSRNQ